MKLVAEPEIRKAASRAVELLCHLAINLRNMKHNPMETLNMLKSVHSSVYQLQQSCEFHSILFATFRNNISLNLQDYSNESKTSAYANALWKSEAYIEGMRRNGAQRLQSCPSINTHQLEDGNIIDRYKSLRRKIYPNRTEALSLNAFISLLIEFVARLDHLVDAVHELCKLANFEEQVV
jgi:Aluminium activated malate transporter